MKRLIVCAVTVAAMVAVATTQAPRKVVLFVKNEASSGLQIPVASLTAGFRAALINTSLQVIDPYDGDPVRSDATHRPGTEALRTESPVDIARRKMAHGYVEFSILSLDASLKHMPHNDHMMYKTRMTFTLVDAGSEAGICSNNPELPVQASREYKFFGRNDPEQRQHLEELLFSSGEKCARELLQNPKLAEWEPTPLPPPPQRLPPPEPLTLGDLRRALEMLSDKMLLSPRFNTRHTAVVQRRDGKQPVIVIGGIGDMTGGRSPCRNLADYCNLNKDFLQTKLVKSCRFEIKDLAADKVMGPFIMNSTKDPLSDRALLEALRRHVSPDFLIAGHIKYNAENGLGTYFIHLGAYDFLEGVVIWQDTFEVEKSLLKGDHK